MHHCYPVVAHAEDLWACLFAQSATDAQLAVDDHLHEESPFDGCCQLRPGPCPECPPKSGRARASFTYDVLPGDHIEPPAELPSHLVHRARVAES